MKLKFINGGLGYYSSLDQKYKYPSPFGDKHCRISSVMGGNYGVGDTYIVSKDNNLYRFTYFGDSSANIKEIEESEIISFLDNQEKHYSNLNYHFKRFY